MASKSWVTREGRVIRIKHMTDSHLINTLRFLERKAERIRLATVMGLCHAEMMVQGEMAGYCIDAEIRAAEDAGPEEFLPKVYQHLVREAEKRKLDWSKPATALTLEAVKKLLMG